MLGYVISAVPLWVWVMLGLLVIGLLFYFFSPILVPLWRMIPKPVKYVIYGILSLFGAFAYGRHKGFKDVKAHDKELEKKAVENRKEIHDEVQKLNPVDTDKRLDRWMRD